MDELARLLPPFPVSYWQAGWVPHYAVRLFEMGNTLDGLGVARAGAIFILPITSYSKATPSEIKWLSASG
jgi:hypothetical protein